MGLYQGDKPLSAGKSPVAYAKNASYYAWIDTNFYIALVSSYSSLETVLKNQIFNVIE